MNYALSQRRSDRHPVGLMIVVGLHVVLAGVLFTAKLQQPPAQPPAIDLHPIAPPEVVKPKLQDLPNVPQQQLHPLQAQIPEVPVDRTDTIEVPKTDDKPVAKSEPTMILASVDKPHEPVRVAARNGSLDAGADKCRPAYPAAAQRLGATGTSRIRFSVDANGHLLGAQILKSSGSSRENRMLDQAAAEALAHCPVTLGNDDQGRAVPFTTDIDYIWSLN